MWTASLTSPYSSSFNWGSGKLFSCPKCLFFSLEARLQAPPPAPLAGLGLTGLTAIFLSRMHGGKLEVGCRQFLQSCFQALQLMTQGILLIPQPLHQLLILSQLFSLRFFFSASICCSLLLHTLYGACWSDTLYPSVTNHLQSEHGIKHKMTDRLNTATLPHKM